MSAHSSNPTDTHPRKDGNVLPFPSRRVQAPGTPPSISRDPRRFPYGLLIVERRLAGGVNGFHWFSTEAEAAHFLRSWIWDWIRDDGTIEWVRSLYAEALRSTSRIEDDWLMDVSEQQDDVLVVWRGFFENLIKGSDCFAASIVADFSKLTLGTGSLGMDIQGFIEYLDVFRGDVRRGP